MSVQRFCHNCGKQVQVGAKFCADCGTNLLSLASQPSPPPEPVHATTFTPFRPTTDEDDDSYIDNLTHLPIRQNALQVEIIKDRPILETIGNAVQMGAQVGPSNDNFDRGKPYQDVDAKKFQQEFQKEAGTLRNEHK